METRPRARACIFHKALGLMLYLLHTYVDKKQQCPIKCIDSCRHTLNPTHQRGHPDSAITEFLISNPALNVQLEYCV